MRFTEKENAEFPADIYHRDKIEEFHKLKKLVESGEIPKDDSFKKYSDLMNRVESIYRSSERSYRSLEVHEKEEIHEIENEARRILDKMREEKKWPSNLDDKPVKSKGFGKSTSEVLSKTAAKTAVQLAVKDTQNY